MCKDVREAAGLGSPSGIFTTNASESINAVMQPKVNYKECEWPAFNQIMQLAQQQREVVWSLSGWGQYRLCTFSACHIIGKNEATAEVQRCRPI